MHFFAALALAAIPSLLTMAMRFASFRDLHDFWLAVFQLGAAVGRT